jgi:hypothetical protein
MANIWGRPKRNAMDEFGPTIKDPKLYVHVTVHRVCSGAVTQCCGLACVPRAGRYLYIKINFGDRQ